jgi:hypothetical protein
MSVRPSSVDRIVARFGGQNAMARSLGIAQSTIWGWVKAGHIPPWRRKSVKAAALKLAPPVKLTGEDFEDFEDEPFATTAAA